MCDVASVFLRTVALEALSANVLLAKSSSAIRELDVISIAWCTNLPKPDALPQSAMRARW